MKKNSPDSTKELLNTLRNEHFDQRALELNRWLAITGFFLSLISLIAIFGGAVGYFSFQSIYSEAIDARDATIALRNEAGTIRDDIQVLRDDAIRSVEQIENDKQIGEQTKKVEQQPEDDFSSTFEAYRVLSTLAGFEQDGELMMGSLQDKGSEDFERVLEEQFSYQTLMFEASEHPAAM